MHGICMEQAFTWMGYIQQRRISSIDGSAQLDARLDEDFR
jgi:hypothetical protein